MSGVDRSSGDSDSDARRAGEKAAAWQRVLLSAPVAALLWRRMESDGSIRLVEINPAAEELTGSALRYFVGLEVDELYGPKNEFADLLRESFSERRAVGREVDYEVLGAREQLRLQVTVHPIDGEHAVTYAVPLDAPAEDGPDSPRLLDASVDHLRNRAARTLLEQGRAICFVWVMGSGGELVLLDYNLRAVEVTDGRCPAWVGMPARAIFAEQPELLATLEAATARGRGERSDARVRFAAGALERSFELAAFRLEREVFLFATERERDRERVEALERLLQSQSGSLQRSTALLDAVLSISPVGYARLDREGIVTEATDRWCELHGCETCDLSMPWMNLVSRADRGRLQEAIEAGDTRRTEYRPRRGRERHLLAELVPDPRDPEAGWLLVALDITPQRQAELRVRAAELEVHRDRKREEIHRRSAGVAHDFNNLLSAINALVETLIQTEDLSGSVRADLEQILVATHRGAVLVEGLMAVGQRQQDDARAVDVGAAARRSLDVLRQLAPAGVSFVVDAREDGPRVWIAPGQLDQILLNLGLNAAQAIDGPGTVRFEVDEGPGPPDAEGRWTVLRVIDDGPGIDPFVRDRLFEPFVTTRSSGGGSGLGLPTVQGIVQRFHGTIDVESTPGGGATFIVRLPAEPQGKVEGAARLAPPAEHPAPRGTVSPGRSTPAVVLLVEDDEIIRSALARALRRRGYQVETAEDGHEGRSKAETTEGLDLVITDVAMPRMSGIELAKSLRRSRPRLPILFLSGHARPEGQEAILREPGTRWLAKPARTTDVIQAIETLLGARSGIEQR